ncbi:MAG: hypothetical protein HOP29_03050 [Phycisphaerales bacterium]|nr:hypothetical protein [Phycisphaerales bacterium]
MNMNRILDLGLCCGLAVIGVAAAPASARHVNVRLAPSVSAVAPGQPFDVAVVFTVDEHWHVYWVNAGDAGQAPKIEWRLPDGFSAGALQFPVPKKHVDRAKLVTNIMEGEPVLLTTITPPAQLAAGSSIKLAADLKWLVCAESCIQESQSVELVLPVAADASGVKPANDDLFKSARRFMPVPGPRGKLVTLDAYLAKGKIAPDAKFEVHLDVDIKKGFHIQSDHPTVKGLIATEVFVWPAGEVYWDPLHFPEPKIKDVPAVGKVAQFDGKITVVLPAEADTDVPGEFRVIGGIFVYQGCDDRTGTCLPREAVEWSVTIPVGVAAEDIPRTPIGAGDDPKASGGTADEKVPSNGTNAPPASPDGFSDRPPNPAPPPKSDAPRADVPTGDRASTDFLGPDFQPAFWEKSAVEQWLEKLGLPGLLLGCFLYGLVLNATPCVLPVLSIKVLGFVRQAHESRRRTFALSLAYGLGVLPLFVVLGFLAAGGKNILQFPVAVIALGAIVTAMALSLLGVFQLNVPTVAANLDAAFQKEGLVTSFGKGLLTPVLGLACVGPFMAGAFAIASQQEKHVALLGFLFAGIGMASPYVLLGANPNWLRFVPRPGNWMVTFERIMGFLLLVMAVYLLNPLVGQIGSAGLQWTFVFFIMIGVGCWILGKINFSMEAVTRWKYRAGAMFVVMLSGAIIYGWIYPLGDAAAFAQSGKSAGPVHGNWDNDIPWQTWVHEDVTAAVAAGRTVFVDFTADYCTNCKANKKLAINVPAVRKKMQDLGIEVYQGDFSNGDARIFAMLQRCNRSGVPLDLVFRPGDPNRPLVLPPLLSESTVLDALSAAGPSRPTPALAKSSP